MKSDRRLLLESYYEQGLQNILSEDFSSEEIQVLSWLNLLKARNFDSFFSEGESLIDTLTECELKNFVVIWLVIGSEVQFDLCKRSQYMKKLILNSNNSFDSFLEFYKIYFRGVGYFFDALLPEAQTLNDKAYAIASSLGFERAQARCLYQRAIIQFDIGNKIEAFNNLKECIKICTQNNFLKTKEKALTEFYIQSDIKPLNAENLDSYIFELQLKIANKEVQPARALLANIEKLRKSYKYSKSKYSLYFYRAQIFILQNKLPAARRIINRLQDKVLQTALYEFMIINDIKLTDVEQVKQKIMTLELGRSTFNTQAHIIKSLEAIQISHIKNIDVRNLISLLLKYPDQPMNKEKIIRSLYRYDYDPTIHDSKLYKLILKARKEISSDLIINHYGQYSLNLKKYKFVG